MPEIQKVTTTEDINVAPERQSQTVKTVEYPKVVPEEQPLKTYEKEKSIFKTHQIVWYVMIVIEVLLFFRIFLKIIVADPQSGFAQFIYAASGIFTLPFSGLVGVTTIGNIIIEWPTFIAGIVYVVIAFLIVFFTDIIKPVTPKEVEKDIHSLSA